MSSNHVPDESAERWRAAQEALRAHHARVEPDAAFAARVLARLPEVEDPFAWAALRLLPAAAVLALLLAGAAFEVGRTPAEFPALGGGGDLLAYAALSGEQP